MPTLKVAGLEKPIAIESIVWIEGDGNYARLHFTTGQFYLAAHTLNWFKKQLSGFIRIHKSVLINPAHVVQFAQTKAKEAQVFMSTGSSLDIARRRIGEVRTMLGMPPFEAHSFLLIDPGSQQNKDQTINFR
ncbi:LytTR family DNA-binding domain-containing protein [Spirosoma agri]|uniref:LytTR family transcriptional regulator n=1 Tax=Spirosoma agri TaxID=1987381 RepID=A0A6M0IRE5_9BACT|nr:LytTR family DNA-binding domain-containing protein [Spirosoma agri]NEU69523.1 LytTR family transcriptional regulator [Spirosoma agri]